jgi:hypothetical protein
MPRLTAGAAFSISAFAVIIGVSDSRGLRLNALRSVFIIVIAGAVAVLSLSGCGGDAGRAKSYMQQGDAEIAKLQVVSNDLTKSVTALFGGIFAGGKVDAASFQKNAVAVQSQAAKLAAGASLARKQYALIDVLKKVPVYKKYADLQIQALDLNAKGVNNLKAFMDKWTPAVAAPGFDPVAFVSASNDLSTQSNTIAASIDKLEKEAASVKTKEKL